MKRLAVRGVSRSFGRTRALGAVSLELERGSIHAVLGENGAGKSTLMKILAGAERPDAGTIELDGVAYAPQSPLDARRRGVAIVYQELSLCPHLNVAENIVLGSEPRRFGVVSEARARERARRALARLEPEGGSLPLDVPVRELSPAERQRVEIARALDQDDCRLLIVDEPTSSLGEDDTERLFTALRYLRGRGLTVLYVSHFLEEVRRIADEYTVLRDGETVAGGRVADVTNDALIAAMAGRQVQVVARQRRERGERLLSLSELGGVRAPERASLELHRGEVLGIAGLMGSGRTELLRAVFGLDPVRRGEVRVGASVGPASPALRWHQGVGLSSEDRAREGLALELDIAQNLTLSKLTRSRGGALARLGWLSLARERQTASDWIARLGIRSSGPEQRVGELSGGNQQKVAIARLLYHDVDVLLLDEPTRGIDVRSRAEIHRLIDEGCARGKAVLLVSSHFDELVALCDRIAVMHRGVLSEARPATGLTEHALLKEAAGA
ncbi:MAG TPA: sugar ABC transporter ATP-binding protein [Polyangiaceae bacterium]|nr:sugar ABC transporter ATP-binding protein [Polyangiaceae bacterium]